MIRRRRKYTESRTSPTNSRRGCLCADGKTYSSKCCDGSLQAQGIGSITMGAVDSAGTISSEDTTNTVGSTSTALDSQGISLFPVVYNYAGDSTGITWYSPISYKALGGEIKLVTDSVSTVVRTGFVNVTSVYTDNIGDDISPPPAEFIIKRWQMDTDFPKVGTFLYDSDGTPIDNRENYAAIDEFDGYPSFSYFNTDRFIILEDVFTNFFSSYFRILNIYRIGNVDGALRIKEQIYNTDTTGYIWAR